MSEEQDKQGDEFSVKDKRRFTEEGEAREGVPEEEPGADEQIIGEGPAARRGGHALPELDFTTFILSLSSSAMMQMGETALPGGGTVQKDLALAKQSIDILDILQEKTRGNLTRDEEQLLQEMLYSLRISFVKAAG